MELLINAGAYSGRLELGGLSLERLEINDGASDVRVEFSQANHTEMSLFRYTTGPPISPWRAGERELQRVRLPQRRWLLRPRLQW